jgi:hypothetical protein
MTEQNPVIRIKNDIVIKDKSNSDRHISPNYGKEYYKLNKGRLIKKTIKIIDINK